MHKVTISTERCKGCGLCVEACPRSLLSLSAKELNEKGYAPVVMGDQSLCTGCGSCYRICPDCVITVEREEEKPAS